MFLRRNALELADDPGKVNALLFAPRKLLVKALFETLEIKSIQRFADKHLAIETGGCFGKPERDHFMDGEGKNQSGGLREHGAPGGQLARCPLLQPPAIKPDAAFAWREVAREQF